MTQYSYELRVRAQSGGATYIWGGPLLKKPFVAAPIFLVCRLDELSVPIDIKLKTSTAAQEIDYGTLGPSETAILPLENGVYISAIPAVVQGDSLVRCTIMM